MWRGRAPVVGGSGDNDRAPVNLDLSPLESRGFGISSGCSITTIVDDAGCSSVCITQQVVLVASAAVKGVGTSISESFSLFS